MSALFSCFVTGTDTDVGKTLISCAMLHALNQLGVPAVGMKPIAAGAIWRAGAWHNDDADALAASSNVALSPELTTPYLLRTAIAPHIAAALDGITIDPAHIFSCYKNITQKSDAIVVEGVGGFRVPLSANYDSADMAVQFGLPIVLIVGLRLGCINHALLTAESIATRGLVLAGWVANTVDPTMQNLSESVIGLTQRLSAPLLGVVPHLAAASAANAVSHVDFSCLPGWPGK